MSNVQSEAKARFQGVVAFKNKQAAIALGVVVNSLLDKMVTIFSEAKINRDAPRYLEQDVQKLIGLCDNFPISAKTDRGARDSEDAVFRMKEHDLNLRSTLAEYEDFKPWTLAQAESIQTSLKGILGELETLMNISERETAEAIISHIKVCLTSLKAVVQAGPHQNFDALADDMTYNNLYLARVLDNRVTVTRDAALKEKLFRANETLKKELQPVVQACDAVRKESTSNNLDAKELHVKTLSGALRDALDVISQGLAALSEFSYRGIEPDKFNDKLDDLINAIQAGDARHVADNARYLAGQLSDLDRRQGLEDAKRRLREQTADLLQASKDALKDKDSDDAKNRLNNIVSAMKNQVKDLAEQEEAKRRRQQLLLKTAGGIGLAMQQMEQAVENADLKDRPKTKAELEKEVEKKFGGSMAADEAKRERDLRDMSNKAGVTYTAPGELYPSASFGAPKITPAYNDSHSYKVSSKNQDDAELDAMLNGLDSTTNTNYNSKSNNNSNSNNNNNNNKSASTAKFSQNDQAELDAMLGGLDAVTPAKKPAASTTPAPVSKPAPAPVAAATSAQNKKKDDKELDDLLSDLGDITFGM